MNPWWGAGSFGSVSWGPGQLIQLATLTGLDDLPGVRSTDTPKGSDQGSHRGGAYLDERVMQATFALLADDPTTYAGLKATCDAAFQSAITNDAPFLINDLSRQVFGRVSRRAVKQANGGRGTYAQYIVEFICADPRIYDAQLQTLTTTAPSGTDGLSWPIVWEASWGRPGGTGLVSCNNDGNFETRPVIQITGPVDVSVTLTNLNTGQSLTFVTPLLASDVLTIDTSDYSALVNGVDRALSLTPDSRWWSLAPGLTTVTYRANTTSSGSQMSLSFYSAST